LGIGCRYGSGVGAMNGVPGGMDMAGTPGCGTGWMVETGGTLLMGCWGWVR